MLFSYFRNAPSPTHSASSTPSTSPSSSTTMHFQTTPTTSASSSPMSIRSSSSSVCSAQDAGSISLSQACAYPSWYAFGGSSRVPSSFVDDADLFFEDELLDGKAPILSEAPAPPRIPVAAEMPLPPLFASNKSKKPRRASKGKSRRSSTKMTPIAEFPEAAE